MSVASYYEDNGELTSYCTAFGTPQEAADWLESDWNDQADAFGGKKLTKKAKQEFLRGLTKDIGISDMVSPENWGAWFTWHAIRTEI